MNSEMGLKLFCVKNETETSHEKTKQKIRVPDNSSFAKYSHGSFVLNKAVLPLFNILDISVKKLLHQALSTHNLPKMINKSIMITWTRNITLFWG